MCGRRRLGTLRGGSRALPLQPLIPFASLDVGDIAGQRLVSALVLSKLSHNHLTEACVQTRDKLRDQVRVLRCLVDGRQGRARSLAFPGHRGGIAVCGHMVVLVKLPLEVSLDLLLHQREVQFSQRVRTEPAAFVCRIIANQRSRLQLIGNAIEADGGGVLETLGAQGLEEKE